MPFAARRPDATIATILLDAEREAGARPALYVEDQVQSFSELADRSRRLAAYLAAHGVRRGQPVALVLPNGAAFVTAHYALALLGAVIVPINPQSGGRIVRYILEKSAAVCVIGTGQVTGWRSDGEPMAGILPAMVLIREDRGSLWLRGDVAAGDEPEIALRQVPPLDARPESAGADPALLFFTSGTTGRPKGVLLTHAQARFGIDAWVNRWSFDEHTVSLMAAPYFHVVYNPLVLGAHRRLGATIAQANLSIPTVTAAIERHRATALMSTPAFMRQLATERWARHRDLSSLNSIIYGAAPTPPPVSRSLAQYFPHAARFNCYGLTETGSALSCLGENEMTGRESSVGRPHPGVEIRVVDADAREAPTGEKGEVWVRGPGVIARYFEEPEIDAQRFYAGWLRTGDVGHVDQHGYLYLLDRLDDQINIAGEKFYPGQIEEVLLSHPSVSEAAVVGVPDDRKGQVVNAFVVATAGGDVDVEALRRLCLDQLPACAVPRRITVLEQLPRNPTGKVLRRDLASLAGP